MGNTEAVPIQIWSLLLEIVFIALFKPLADLHVLQEHLKRRQEHTLPHDNSALSEPELDDRHLKVSGLTD